MTDLVKQPTKEPTRKTTSSIAAASIATAASTLLTWVLQTYTHVELPAPVQVALATLLTVLAAYMTHERA